MCNVHIEQSLISHLPFAHSVSAIQMFNSGFNCFVVTSFQCIRSIKLWSIWCNRLNTISIWKNWFHWNSFYFNFFTFLCFTLYWNMYSIFCLLWFACGAHTRDTHTKSNTPKKENSQFNMDIFIIILIIEKNLFTSI